MPTFKLDDYDECPPKEFKLSYPDYYVEIIINSKKTGEEIAKFRIPREQYEEMTEYAKLMNIPIEEVVEKAIKEGIKITKKENESQENI